MPRRRARASARRSPGSWWRSCRRRRPCTGVSAARPSTRWRHGDAVVEPGGDRRRRRAARRRRPSTIRSSPLPRTATPQAARPSAMAAIRSLSLTRSSPGRASSCALGEGGRDGQDRVFVDHRRRALGRDLDAAAARAARAVTSPTGSPPSRARWRSSRSAPISRRVSNRPVRSGLSRHCPTVTSRARHDQRGDQREGGRRRIARHVHRSAPASSGWPVDAMRRRAVVGVARPRPRRRMAQHPLGVVARRLRSRSPWCCPAR